MQTTSFETGSIKCPLNLQKNVAKCGQTARALKAHIVLYQRDKWQPGIIFFERFFERSKLHKAYRAILRQADSNSS